jgi:hypothetical protein
MAFAPVNQWTRVITALNERDWATCEALHADEFNQVIVVGDLYSATPTYQNRQDRAHGRKPAGWPSSAANTATL